MGFDKYSFETSRLRTVSYSTKSIGEVFQSRSINNAMDPHGVTLRESRDSEKHPNSIAIVIALDVTGSMGSVPHYLVKEGLNNIIEKIVQGGIPDPQVLFLGIGDHECDHSPLQVGQFESSDDLMDKWLTSIYLEGGGGANAGESYLLAWYFAGNHTSIDCMEKRKLKGYLFTIGDEPTLKEIPPQGLKKIMGDGQYGNSSALELLDKARQTYNVKHIHIAETGAGRRPETVNGWRQLMADDLIIADHKEDVSNIIANVVLSTIKTPINKPEPSKPVEIIL